MVTSRIDTKNLLKRKPGIDRIDNDLGRFYRIRSGHQILLYPSASTVVSKIGKDYIEGWRKAIGAARADHITEHAAFRGTQLHAMAENFLNGKEPFEIGDIPHQMPKFLFKKMLPALEKINKVRAIELTVFSRELGIAGTLDVCGDYEEEPAIIDFKTGKREVTPEKIRGYFAQTSIYAHAILELYGVRVKNSVIIMATETGKLQVFKEDPFLQTTVNEIIEAKWNLFNEFKETASRRKQ